MRGGVRKRGNKWYYYFELAIVEGKRKKIERVGGDTKKEAQTALRIALSEYEDCGNVFDENNISVSDFLDFWYKEYVMLNCKFQTQNNYKRAIENHIKPNLGRYKLKLITPLIIQKFLNDKSKENYSSGTIRVIKGVLNNSFKMAVYPYKFIKENPMFYIKVPKNAIENKENNKLKIITLDEFNTIIKKYNKEHYMNIVLNIGFSTGMRAGEVLGLRWEDIDLKNKIIKVRHTLIDKGNGIFELTTPKTDSSVRDIQIGDSLIKSLKEKKIEQKELKLKYGQWYFDSDWVCTKKNGSQITLHSLKNMSRTINRDLGIDFNFHSLRHTHATMLLEAGANIKDIQKRLGHNKIATTMDTYSHVTNKMKTETVNIFEGIIK
ncbi:site-specific integrase [Clostridioides difficile]|uniref:tyrosine-type recombinase/integrase n=1 Tax=Clostridioides difficile TaxID=1496 RepID=UPI00097FEFA4|nr:tyrosine-type recombinase/integrase [Clostridioides difficile]EGT4600766.1 site-specific integrase [Clostridioides difficile]SJS15428.1 Integrase [Clostridioides difficile]HBG8468870.1 site-specific integrase [Clostridioides difficile]